MPSWTAADMPSQAGRVAVVTGANSGIGLVAARELARAGATVALACRAPARASAAAESIMAAAPDASIDIWQLDLADLGSVRECAAGLGESYPKIDLLLNNAGVMALPRELTPDGFERQIGTNHLGHFAFTGLLLEHLLAAPEPRVVTVASGAHRMGRMNFDDLQGERSYNRWRAYGQSKLANLLFMFELQRRSVAAGTELRSLAAHPGYAATNLQSHSGNAIETAVMKVLNTAVAQSDEKGALPSLYAATMELPGGTYIGPDGIAESRGNPTVVSCSSRARDAGDAARLWELSEQLTGVSFAWPALAPA